MALVLSGAEQAIADPGGDRVEASAAGKGEAQRLRATIRRTTYGVPHITAHSLRGLGFGFAYAFAEDNICTIADSYVTVAGERSRYFGPDGSWTFSGNGSVNNNLESDFFYERINRSGVIQDLVSSPPPQGPMPGVEKLVRGYVDGYNVYLRRTGVDGISDPRCRGASWVRPIRPVDVYRRFHQLGSLASSGVAIEGIAGAAPLPGSEASAALERQRRALGSPELDALQPALGSNAYGLGAEATANGRGMVLGNPHFPWDGAERLYQAHLRIPGELDAQGGTLYGVPLVLVGWTRGLAWSHTVASAWRFTPFELTLPPGDPHSYVVDGQVKPMDATEVTVDVKTDAGIEQRTRTLYETEYGPMFTEIAGLPFPWTQRKGFALGDVNARNLRYLNHFLLTNRAQSVPEYDRIERDIQGIPWVNSIAADREGRAYYSMDGAIPNVPDEKAAGCNTATGQALFPLTGIAVLDGARSTCAWEDDPAAVAPGIFAPGAIPRLLRRDYVHNGNDSHWLTNPTQPLEGFHRIIGDERTERSLRTRLGLVQVEQRLSGNDGLPGNRFTLEALEQVALGNRQHAGELWRDELVSLCETLPIMVGSGGPVSVSEACPALAAWDLHDDLDSPGAILFRRFATRLLANFPLLPSGTSSGQRPGGGTLFTQPFAAGDAVHTPSGLNVVNPLVQRALADAVRDLRDAGIPLDAPLRGRQYEERGGDAIPIHGGPGGLGVFNAIQATWDPSAGGFPDVPHGTSFIFAAGFEDGRCPVRAGTLLSYSLSENPQSPHAADYTRAFSEKAWHRAPFCEREIQSDPNLAVKRISAPR